METKDDLDSSFIDWINENLHSLKNHTANLDVANNVLQRLDAFASAANSYVQRKNHQIANLYANHPMMNNNSPQNFNVLQQLEVAANISNANNPQLLKEAASLLSKLDIEKQYLEARLRECAAKAAYEAKRMLDELDNKENEMHEILQQNKELRNTNDVNVKVVDELQGILTERERYVEDQRREIELLRSALSYGGIPNGHDLLHERDILQQQVKTANDQLDQSLDAMDGLTMTIDRLQSELTALRTELDQQNNDYHVVYLQLRETGAELENLHEKHADSLLALSAAQQEANDLRDRLTQEKLAFDHSVEVEVTARDQKIAQLTVSLTEALYSISDLQHALLEAKRQSSNTTRSLETELQAARTLSSENEARLAKVIKQAEHAEQLLFVVAEEKEQVLLQLHAMSTAFEQQRASLQTVHDQDKEELATQLAQLQQRLQQTEVTFVESNNQISLQAEEIADLKHMLEEMNAIVEAATQEAAIASCQLTAAMEGQKMTNADKDTLQQQITALMADKEELTHANKAFEEQVRALQDQLHAVMVSHDQVKVEHAATIQKHFIVEQRLQEVHTQLSEVSTEKERIFSEHEQVFVQIETLEFAHHQLQVDHHHVSNNLLAQVTEERDEAQHDLRIVQDKITELEQGIERLRSDKIDLQQQYDDQQAQLLSSVADRDSQLHAAVDKIAALKVRIQSKAEVESAANQKIATLQAVLTNSQSTIEAEQGKISKMKDAIKKLKQEKAELEEAVTNKEQALLDESFKFDCLELEFAQFKLFSESSIAEMEAATSSLQQALRESQEELSQIRTQTSTLSTSLGEANTSMQRKDNELASLHSALDAVKQANCALEEMMKIRLQSAAVEINGLKIQLQSKIDYETAANLEIAILQAAFTNSQSMSVSEQAKLIEMKETIVRIKQEKAELEEVLAEKGKTLQAEITKSESRQQELADRAHQLSVLGDKLQLITAAKLDINALLTEKEVIISEQLQYKEQADQELIFLRQAKSSHEQLLAEANISLAMKDTELNTVMAELASLRSTLSRSESGSGLKITELQSALTTAQQTINELEVKRAKLKKAVKKLQLEKTELEEAIKNKEQALLAEVASAESMERGLAQACQQNAHLEEQQKLSADELVKLQQLVNDQAQHLSQQADELSQSQQQVAKIEEELMTARRIFHENEATARELSQQKEQTEETIAFLNQIIAAKEHKLAEINDSLVQTSIDNDRLQAQVSELSTALSAAHDSLNNKENELSSLRSTLSGSESESNQKITQLQAALTTAQQTISDSEYKRTKLKKAVEKLRQEKIVLEEGMKDSEQRLQTKLTRAELLERDLVQAHKQYAQFNEELKLSTDKSTKLQQLSIDQAQQLSQQADHIESISAKADSLEADLLQAQQQVARLKEEQRQSSDELKSVQRLLDVSITEKKSLELVLSEQNYQAEEKIAALNQTIAAKKQVLTEINESLAQVNSDNDQLQAQVSELSGQLKAAHDSVESKESELASLRSTLSRSESGSGLKITELQSALTTAQQTINELEVKRAKLKKAAERLRQEKTELEEAIKNKEQALQVETIRVESLEKDLTQSRQQCERYLEEKLQLITESAKQQQLLSQQKEQANLDIVSLKQSVVVAEEQLSELSERLKAAYNSLESKESELASLRSALSGSESESSQKISELKSSLTSAQQTINDNEVKRAKLKKAVEKLRQEKAELEEAIKNQKQTLQAEMTIADSLEKDLTQAHNQCKRYEEEKRQLLAESSKQQQLLDAVVIEKEATMFELSQQKEEADSEVAYLKQSITVTEEQVSELSERLKAAYNSLESKESELVALRSALSGNESESSQKITELQLALATAQQTISDDIEIKKTELKEALEILRLEKAELEEAIEYKEQTLQAETTRSEALDQELVHSRQQYAKLEEVYSKNLVKQQQLFECTFAEKESVELQLSQQKEQADTEITSLKQSLAVTEEEIAKLSESLMTTQHMVDSKKNELVAIRSALSGSESESSQKISELQSVLSTAQQTINELEAKRIKMKSKNEALRTETSGLKEELKKKEEALVAESNKANNLTMQVVALMSDYEIAKSSYEESKTSLQDQIESSKAVVNHLIRSLGEAKESLQSFEAARAIQECQIQALIDEKAASTTALAETEATLVSCQTEHAQKMATMEEILQSKENELQQVTEGSASQINRLKAELATVTLDKDALRLSVEGMQHQISLQSAELTHLHLALSGTQLEARQEVMDLEEALTASQATVIELESTTATMKTDYEKLQQENNELVYSLQKSQLQLEEMKTALSHQSSVIMSLQAIETESKQEKDRLIEELASSQEAMNQLQSDLAVLEDKLLSFQSQSDQKILELEQALLVERSKAHDLSQLLEQKTLTLEQLQQNYDDAQTSFASQKTVLEAQLSLKQKEVSDMRATVDTLQLQSTEQTAKISQQEETIHDMQHQISLQSAELTHLHLALSGTQSEARQEVMDLEEALTASQATVTQARDQASHKQQEIDHLVEELASSHEATIRLQSDLHDLENKLFSLQQGFDETQTSLASQKSELNIELSSKQVEMLTLRAQLETQTVQIAELEAQIAHTHNTLQSAQSELQYQVLALTSQRDSLKAELVAEQAKSLDLSEALQALKQRLDEHRASFESQKVELENQLSVKQEELSTMTTQAQNDAVKIAKLEAIVSESRSLLSAREDYIALMEEQVVHTRITTQSELQQQVIAVSSERDKLQEELITEREVLVNAMKRSHDEQLDQLQSTISSLRLTIVDQEERLSLEQDHRAALAIEMTEMKEELESSQHENNRLVEELAMLQDALSRLQSEVEDTSSRVVDKASHVQQLLASLDEKDSLIKTNEAKIKELTADNKVKRSDLEEIEGQLASINHQFELATKENHSLVDEMTAANATITAHLDHKQAFQAEIIRLEAAVQSLETEKSAMLAQHQQHITTIFNESSRLVTELGSLKQALLQSQHELENCESTMQRKNHENRELRESLEKLHKVMAEKEASLFTEKDQQFVNLQETLDKERLTTASLQQRLRPQEEELRSIKQELFDTRMNEAALSSQVTALTEENQVAAAKIYTMHEEAMILQEEIDQLQHHSKLQPELESAQQNILALSAEIEAANLRISVLEESLQSSEQSLSMAMRDIEKHFSEVEQLRQQVQTMQSNIHQLQQALSIAQESLAAKQLKLENSRSLQQEQETKNKTKIQRLQESILSLESSQKKAKQENTLLTQEKNELQCELQRQVIAIKRLEQRCNDYAAEADQVISSLASLGLSSSSLSHAFEQLIGPVDSYPPDQACLSSLPTPILLHLVMVTCVGSPMSISNSQSHHSMSWGRTRADSHHTDNTVTGLEMQSEAGDFGQHTHSEPNFQDLDEHREDAEYLLQQLITCRMNYASACLELSQLKLKVRKDKIRRMELRAQRMTGLQQQSAKSRTISMTAMPFAAMLGVGNSSNNASSSALTASSNIISSMGPPKSRARTSTAALSALTTTDDTEEKPSHAGDEQQQQQQQLLDESGTPRAGQLAQKIAQTGRRFLIYDMFGER